MRFSIIFKLELIAVSRESYLSPILVKLRMKDGVIFSMQQSGHVSVTSSAPAIIITSDYLGRDRNPERTRYFFYKPLGIIGSSRLCSKTSRAGNTTHPPTWVQPLITQVCVFVIIWIRRRRKTNSCESSDFRPLWQTKGHDQVNIRKNK